MWNTKQLREDYDTLAPGATVRINHDACPSGADTRRRLYITRSNDSTSLKCYCHNCGKGTVINLYGPKLRSVVPEPEPKVLELPKMWVSDTMVTPRHRRWLEAYGIIYRSRAYSANDNELVFPSYDVDNPHLLTGYQIRYFDGRKPKWKSYGTPASGMGGKIVIVTEDIISSLKWANTVPDSGYICLAGHRSDIPMHLFSPLRQANLLIVWLDNDKPSVVEASEQLAHYGVGGTTVLIRGGTDPKRYPKNELKKVFDVCSELIRTPPPDGGSYHVLEIRNPGEGVCA
jgi:hypothetical protein